MKNPCKPTGIYNTFSDENHASKNTKIKKRVGVVENKKQLFICVNNDAENRAFSYA